MANNTTTLMFECLDLHNYGEYIIYLLVGCHGLVTNAAVALILLKREFRNTPLSRFYISMALGDLLLSWIPILVSLRCYLRWTETSCKIYGHILYVGFCVSVNTVIALVIERFAAVRTPVFFKRFATSRHVNLLVVVVWTISVLETVYPSYYIKLFPTVLITEEDDIMLYVCTVDIVSIAPYHISIMTLLPIVVVVIFAIPTIRTLHVRRKQDRISGSGNPITASDNPIGNRIQPTGTGNASSGRVKISRPCLIISITFVCFLVSYLPMTSYLFVLYLNPTAVRLARGINTVSFLGYILFYLHTAVGPYTHLICNREFRKACKSVCRVGRQNRREALEVGTALSPISSNVRTRPPQVRSSRY